MISRLANRIALICTLLWLLPGSTAASADESAQTDLRVLFIGNSLTYTHDLPAVVRRLAAADGRSIHTRMVASPNAGLQDHWNSRRIQGLIKRGRWSHVVMQQGPSSLAASQLDLKYWSMRWSELVRQAGARPALLMVWPPTYRLRAFDAVDHAYTEAARAARAELYPAGRAWLAAWTHDPGLPLYGSDGLHPGRMGTLLSALVVYAGICGRAPTALPDRIQVGDRELQLSAATRTVLLQAVGGLMVGSSQRLSKDGRQTSLPGCAFRPADCGPKEQLLCTGLAGPTLPDQSMAVIQRRAYSGHRQPNRANSVSRSGD